jgi:8-oxo-dGTP pyrophosphatase MutT (NUDIX family)
MSEFLIEKLIPRIADNLSNGLPGEYAHKKLSPQHRLPASAYLEKETNYRIACVMALLFPDDETGEARLILMERTGGEDAHAGQISFPGGKIEPEDKSNLHTALRETREEIGVISESINILGALSSLYIPPSKFLVFPFLGVLKNIPEFTISEMEVSRIISPFLREFSNPENIKSGEFISARGYVVNAPYYEVEGVKIWGATAMMISELIALT